MKLRGDIRKTSNILSLCVPPYCKQHIVQETNIFILESGTEPVLKYFPTVLCTVFNTAMIKWDILIYLPATLFKGNIHTL